MMTDYSMFYSDHELFSDTIPKKQQKLEYLAGFVYGFIALSSKCHRHMYIYCQVHAMKKR